MNRYLSIVALLLVLFACTQTKNNAFVQETVWNDANGDSINAHGGALLYHQGKYYWYGEAFKNGKYEGDTVARIAGIACYSSSDLYNWENEGIVLPLDSVKKVAGTEHIEFVRKARVLYNEGTHKFVMWMHVENESKNYAHAGIATSDRPAGPYTFVKSLQPNERMSADQTLFKDDNGKAYQICSSGNNASIYVNELTGDYMSTTGRISRLFIGLWRKTPVMVKNNGLYYVLASAPGNDPNLLLYAVADSALAEYRIAGNPCVGKDAEKSFQSQISFILPVEGKTGSYIAMFDKWNRTDPRKSQYVWLPVQFDHGKMIIEWKDKWRID
jgi:hypothetical protein